MDRKEGLEEIKNVYPQLNRNVFLQSMTSEVPGPSSQMTLHNDVSVVSNDGFLSGKYVNNVSVQTGEEFSMEFLQDRVAPGRAFERPDIQQGYSVRMGFNFNQNVHLGYENPTGVVGLRRTESERSFDVPNFALGTGYVFGLDDKDYSNKASNVHKEASRHVPSKSLEEIYWEQAVPSRDAHSSDFLSEFSHGYRASDSSQYGKMKFLCSFGGRILPRPSDGKLRYVGGETRIISIRKNHSWHELMQKTLGICNQPHTIKYQLPGEDLDSLISVSSDEDLQNMMEEYDGLEKVDGSQRLRIFLISSNESENCSFDARGNSEYHYVVAVNGIVDPSLSKSSSGHSLASQLGHNYDGSPILRRDSPTSLLPLDTTSSANMAGVFSYPSAAQLFVAAQNATKSPTNSPPFSPLPLQRKISRNIQKQLYEDQFCYGGNENTAFLTDQEPENPFAVDTSYHHHHPNKYMDADQPIKPRGVHFHHCTPNRDFAAPTFGRVWSDLDGYSFCEKPLLNERAFHSEKFSRQQEDSLGLSASNDSIGSHHGMPHVLSDSILQEHGGRSVYGLQERTIAPLVFTTGPSSLLDSPSFLQEIQMRSQEHRDIIDSEFKTKLSHTMGTHVIGEEHQSKENLDEASFRSRNCYAKPELNCEKLAQMDKKGALWNQDGNHHDSNINRAPVTATSQSEFPGIDNHLTGMLGSHISPQELEVSNIIAPVTATSQSEFPGIDNHLTGMLGIHISPQELEVSNIIAPISSSNALEVCPDIRKEHCLGFQKDETTSELSVVGQRATKDQQCSLAEPLNGNLRRVNSNAITYVPPFPLSNNSSEVVGLDKIPDLICGSSNDLISFVSPELQSVESQNTKASQEAKVVSTVNLSSLAAQSDTGLGLNLHTNNPTTWSLFRNGPMDETYRREASLIYQDPVNYPSPMGEEVDMGEYHYKPLKGEDVIIVHEQPKNNSREQIQLESVVIVEDVTDTVPSGVGSFPPVVPHVHHETIEDVQVQDIPSPNATDAESTTPESTSEDAKTDDRDVDESISDAAIAEMEAGIYGLQIIKNADLEELRELGSGTFGTVYHGKWRGTDVAIKRIKKSCFAGRSSEQERLTKDFWREAQILSKLHHPNVVAFYGVVPDGAGGTLATITEFMVNGSLRHVLVRKDKALDRRKRLIIAMDAAFGMEYLHSKNIVHFDLKCDNLLVNLRDSHRPICKVGDFGLSRIKRNTLVSGGVRGTLPWMAPELLNGSSIRVSEKVDVFSFGIAMWEILTGEEPYASMHCGAIIGGIVNNTLRPTIPDRCDPEWRKLMEECWSPDPEARPSFTEITSRLRVMSMAVHTKGNSPAANK
ncbi:RAF-like serine/threonine-protein kinase 20 [Tasmannia lanceolata]|uniref:RAF-like serine/threonine-protein kinase 20 n=1 Tax=Tasmannia lanceolata TaxID=3420 RepID=UPI0040644663